MKNLFKHHEIQFLVWFSVIFLISVAFLAAVGLLPSEFTPGGGETFEQKTRNAVREIIEGKTLDSGNSTSGNTISGDKNNTSDQNRGSQNPNAGSGTVIDTSSQVKTSRGETMYAEEPTRLVITSIGVDTLISNPVSTSYEVLDAALTQAPVRYPGSGLPGIGNMFIFGHSTGFKVVQNQAYKVFNRLKELQTGYIITVYSKSAIYDYKITTVKKVDKSQELVQFDTTNNMLTLSTCDSFGRAADRYVVEAELVSIVKR